MRIKNYEISKYHSPAIPPPRHLGSGDAQYRYWARRRRFSLIDQYYADRGEYPATLEELVSEHYIRTLPIDPFTKSSSSWEEILEEKDQEDDSPAGIYDVKSGSDLTALDGRPYNEW